MPNHNKKKHILIVEDDLLLRELYVELLSNEGYTITEASDGLEGFEKILEGGFNLILLDIMLPKKDGLQILEDLQKAKPEHANGPIVILTNLSQDKVVKQCLSFGASYFLIKSMLTPNEVLREVRMVLRQSQ